MRVNLNLHQEASKQMSKNHLLSGISNDKALLLTCHSLRCFVVHPAVFPLRSRSTTAGDWLWLVAILILTLFVLLPVSGDITHPRLPVHSYNICVCFPHTWAVWHKVVWIFGFVFIAVVWRTSLWVSNWSDWVCVVKSGRMWFCRDWHGLQLQLDLNVFYIFLLQVLTANIQISYNRFRSNNIS